MSIALLPLIFDFFILSHSICKVPRINLRKSVRYQISIKAIPDAYKDDKDVILKKLELDSQYAIEIKKLELLDQRLKLKDQRLRLLDQRKNMVDIFKTAFTSISVIVISAVAFIAAKGIEKAKSDVQKFLHSTAGKSILGFYGFSLITYLIASLTIIFRSKFKLYLHS